MRFTTYANDFNLIQTMKEHPIMNKIQRDLIRKYHAVAASAGLSDADRAALLEGYGVSSSRDLTQHELIDLIATITARMDSERDRLRKQLMASIGRYLRTAGYPESLEMIKAVAVRASGCESFNKIPPERLRSLAYAFTHKMSDLTRVEAMTDETLRDIREWVKSHKSSNTND